MTYKTINVLVDNNTHLEQRLSIAVKTAERFSAHLVGLHVVPPINYPTLATADLPADILAQRYDSLQDAAANLRQVFESHVANSGLNYEWRQVNSVAGDLRSSVAEMGRYADLNIITQTEDDPTGMNDVDFAEPLLFHSGRPVLIIPYAGEYTAEPKKILASWDASQPATRALHDAIPMLQQADEVCVLTVNPSDTIEGGGAFAGVDITNTLARHDINAEVKHIPGSTIPIADMLLSTVADYGFELLVMGGYGHSKLREWVFGGTTQDMLDRMTLPVMMSH